MKHIIRILVLAVTLATGLMSASAQTVQVILISKPALPSTAISYLEDPFSRYFNIQFIVNGVGSEGLDIFFDMNITVNTNPRLYVRTRPEMLPMQPIHVHEGVNLMSADALNTQVLMRTVTSYDYNNILDAQQLPEGTYTLCVDIYRWSDKDNPARESITIGPCPTFIICYSASAPELTAPMEGAQLALTGTQVLIPDQKIHFMWTPVISNCAGKSANFDYELKVVKVTKGQNYRDAIRVNATVLSTMVKDKTFAVFDTLRDVKVVMEKGALYVAQVQAKQVQEQTRNGSWERFNVANDGKSQPMPFYWGYAEGENLMSSQLGGLVDPNIYPNGILDENIDSPTESYKRRYGYSLEYEDGEEGDESEGIEGLTIWDGGIEEVSELDNIQDEMKKQYLAGFIQDAAAVADLTEAYPDERQYVPTPKHRYVESDGYYTVPMTDDLEVSFMPTRHKSLKNVSYTIELYEYMEGGIDSITAYEPLFVEEIEEVPERYNKMDSHELISRTLAGWGEELEQGSLYYLQLSSYYTVDYWNYSISDTSFYVNEMLAEHIHDTVSREFVEEELEYANGVMFQWGDNPEAPEFTTPQWKAPVDRTSDDIYDPVNYALPTSVPEIQKAKTFPVSWTPVKNVTKGDKVEYEVNVYELKPDQTLEKAISSNEALVTRTITDANEISDNDKDFFKVFSPKKTYVMTLSTNVTGDSDTIYHFENGNKALPIVFKVVK
ncbi:MAG: hypothetical protein IKX35_07380 [Bacteroidales bacterium]|nr:hypothetical protein [Bacteroidales bacterium]